MGLTLLGINTHYSLCAVLVLNENGSCFINLCLLVSCLLNKLPMWVIKVNKASSLFYLSAVAMCSLNACTSQLCHGFAEGYVAT